MEQREAAFGDLLRMTETLAHSFEAFSPSIARGMEEKAIERQSHEREMDEVMKSFEEQITKIDSSVNNDTDKQEDFGEVLGVNLNSRQGILDYLNSEEEESNLLNIGDFVEESAKEEEQLKEEIKRRLVSNKFSSSKPAETFQEIEKENVIKESLSIIISLRKAMSFHGIHKDVNGKWI